MSAIREIKLNYVSVERFLSDYKQLCKGRILLPVNAALPVNTRVNLLISIPVIDQKVTVEAAVTKSLDQRAAAPSSKPGKMLVGLTASPAVALRDLNYALSSYQDYREILDLAPPESYRRKPLKSGRKQPPANLKPPEDETPEPEASKIREPESAEPGRTAEPGAAAHTAIASDAERQLVVNQEKFPPNPDQPPAKLPADAQYSVTTDKLAKDVQRNLQGYVKRVLQIKSASEAAVMLKLFRRILPVLVETSAWPTAIYLTRALNKIIGTTDLFKPASGLTADPLGFVFRDHAEEIAAAYEKADPGGRILINELCRSLGMLGVEILCGALSRSQDRIARKAAMEALKELGSLARDWIFKVLDDPGQEWYLIRNALMLLGYVANDAQDFIYARKFLNHGDPRVRYEALNAFIAQKAEDAEQHAVAALDDADEKVRWRALNGLGELEVISEDSIRKLLAKICAAAPDDKAAADGHNRKTAQLIRALGGITHIPNHAEAEDAILDLARGLSNQKKGLLKRFKKAGSSDQTMVLSSALSTLGYIGTAKSESFLEGLAQSSSPLAEAAQKAANNIKLRVIEALSNTPSDLRLPIGM